MTADERQALRAAVDERRRELEGVPTEILPTTDTGRPAHWSHGSETGYTGGRCRCDDCRVAANVARAARRLRPNVSVHGTHSGYANGCRCDACRAGHRVYYRKRKTAPREGVLVTVARSQRREDSARRERRARLLAACADGSPVEARVQVRAVMRMIDQAARKAQP